MARDTTAAQVVDIIGRSGVKGVVKIKCRVLDGKDKERVLIRNAMGPIKIGDIIMLKETEMESSEGFGRR